MRRIVVLLGCLALMGAGCLNRVAQLVGDGGPSDDGGVGCGLGNGDAGICISDSQCPDNYYCDFSVTACSDAGGLDWSQPYTINLSNCLPACPATGHPTAAGAACHVAEDCAPSEMCVSDDGGICTNSTPCEVGACWEAEISAVQGCASPSCHAVQEPHTALEFCVCDGNICIEPDAGPADAGSADAGEDAGSDAGGPLNAGNMDAGVIVDGGPTLYLSLASADLNGDGILDLVAAVFPQQGIDGFDIFLGNSDGGLGAPTHYAGCDGEANPAIGDVNGDGLADITVSYAGGVNVFLQLGDGGFADPAFYASVNLVTGLGLGDINGDGSLDLVMAELLGGSPGGIEVRLNQGGLFGGSSVLDGTGNFWGGLAVADFNQDGLADIASDSADGTGVSLMLSEGDGGFTADTIPVSPEGGQMVAVPIVSGSPELAFGNYGSLQTLISSGSEGFVAGGTYSLSDPSIGFWINSGDFNDDGIVDLAVSGWTGTGLPDGGAIWTGGENVLLGLGDGGFGAATQVAVGYFASGLAALGPVDHPRALAMANVLGGITVYGDASRH